MEKTQLQHLFESVKEEHLSKSDLEKYHSELTMLFAGMHLSMGEIEKREAIFMEAAHTTESALSDIAIKRKWNVTEDGQRLITLKHSAKAAEKVLSSIKNRLYNFY